jgi:hypothetical protein
VRRYGTNIPYEYFTFDIIGLVPFFQTRKASPGNTGLGGKGGAILRVHTNKDFGKIPYFLVIAD